MNKDSQAKLGRTKCDFCSEPSIQARGRLVVCAAHAAQPPDTAVGIKQGSAREVPLKSAGLLAEDLHS